MNSRRLTLKEYSSLYNRLLESGVNQPAPKEIIQEIIDDLGCISHGDLTKRLSDTLFIDSDAANYFISKHINELIKSRNVSYNEATFCYTTK